MADGGVNIHCYHDLLSFQETHESPTYQLLVKVDGWLKSPPIRIDKVGQFFSTVQPDAHSSLQVRVKFTLVKLFAPFMFCVLFAGRNMCKN